MRTRFYPISIEQGCMFGTECSTPSGPMYRPGMRMPFTHSVRTGASVGGVAVGCGAAAAKPTAVRPRSASALKTIRSVCIETSPSCASSMGRGRRVPPLGTGPCGLSIDLAAFLPSAYHRRGKATVLTRSAPGRTRHHVITHRLTSLKHILCQTETCPEHATDIVHTEGVR